MDFDRGAVAMRGLIRINSSRLVEDITCISMQIKKNSNQTPFSRQALPL